MRSRMRRAARHKDRGSKSEVTVRVLIKIIGSAGLIIGCDLSIPRGWRLDFEANYRYKDREILRKQMACQ